MKVLVADDSSTSRMVICSLLKKWDHEVVECANGYEAWEVLQKEDGPRIAILDWMMPEMNGPELCRKLEQRAEGALVYTILLTSKTERRDMIMGLSSGAHTFIKKPCDAAELHTWLTVGARILSYEQELAETNNRLKTYATQMEQLAQERAAQLVHADRMATLGLMAAGIAHEVNNSTSMISGNIQTVERFWPYMKTALEQQLAQQADASDRLPFILDEMPGILSGVRKGVERVTKIVAGLKAFARRDVQERSPFSIKKCIHDALDLCPITLRRPFEITVTAPDDLPHVDANEQQVEQVLVNLIVNACDAMSESGTGTELHIVAESNTDNVVVHVLDTGPGIDTKKLEMIWQPFFTTKPVGKGTGLGLSISHGLIEENGGSITVENRPEGGAHFIIRLPRADRNVAE